MTSCNNCLIAYCSSSLLRVEHSVRYPGSEFVLGIFAGMVDRTLAKEIRWCSRIVVQSQSAIAELCRAPPNWNRYLSLYRYRGQHETVGSASEQNRQCFFG